MNLRKAEKFQELRRIMVNNPPQTFDEVKEILKELFRLSSDYDPSKEDEIDELAHTSVMRMLYVIKEGQK